MSPDLLQTYRDHYADTALGDIWDKIANVLDEAGIDSAEQHALKLTEWLRTTWGGQMLCDRHRDDPADANRWDHLAARAVELGIAPGVCLEIVRVVRIDYRGKYLPKLPRIDLLARDYQIWLHGNSHGQLERQTKAHGISVVRAYQINKQFQANRQRREQPELF